MPGSDEIGCYEAGPPNTHFMSARPSALLLAQMYHLKSEVSKLKPRTT